MNTARIVVLAIAVGAGGVAAYLASGSDNKPAPAAPAAQLPTVDVLVAKSDIGLGQTVKPEDMHGRPGRRRPRATPSFAATNAPTRPPSSPARSRALPSSRANRSASRSWSRPTAPASWRRSCPPACAPSRPKSRRKPAPAASSCPTTASTSSCPSARRIRTGFGRGRHRQLRNHPVEYPRARDRPGAEGKRRPEHRGRQDRHARTEARTGRDARRARARPARCRWRCAASPTSTWPRTPTIRFEKARRKRQRRSLRRPERDDDDRSDERTHDMKCGEISASDADLLWSAPCRFRPSPRSRSTRR